MESRAAKVELKKELDAQKDDPECTFRPKIATASYNNRNGSPGSPGERNILSVHERNRIWQNKKESRMAEARDINRDRDLLGCTFRPDLVLNPRVF